MNGGRKRGLTRFNKNNTVSHLVDVGREGFDGGRVGLREEGACGEGREGRESESLLREGEGER